MSSPRLLDLFCCEGGASAGYAHAGFKVVGVDIDAQPRYPFAFHQADALRFLERYGSRFDAIHASPPCQAFTKAQRLRGNDHPDLIGPVRELLQSLGKPYVIENVVGAPLSDPLMLCGGMFGLRTYRHRLFESNIDLTAPDHGEHASRTTKMGRKLVDGEFMHIVGHFSGVDAGRQAMGMPWASRCGLSEAVPPAYTEHIGKQLLQHIESERAA